MAPPKKRLKTFRDGNSCETAPDVPPASARGPPSAYVAIFGNGPGRDPTFCKFTKKRMIFDSEDPNGAFRKVFSRLNPDGAPFPVRITFAQYGNGNYTLRIPRGGDLVTVHVNMRLVSPHLHGVRLKNGDLVQFYTEKRLPPCRNWWCKTVFGPMDFQFFVGEEKQPKRRSTAKRPSWVLMPPEILENIFNRLPVQDLLENVAGTCQKFRCVVFSGSLKPPVLELKLWLTQEESAGIDLIYGPNGLSQVKKFVVFKFSAGCRDVLKNLVRRLEGLEVLDLRSPDRCDCNRVTFVGGDELHPSAQLKVLKLFRGENNNQKLEMASGNLTTLLGSSLEHCRLSVPHESNPPSYFVRLMNRVESRSCTFVFACNNGRSKWTYGPWTVGQERIRHLDFEGVYFPGLLSSQGGYLVRLSLTIFSKDLRAFFRDLLYPVYAFLRDLTLRIEDDGSFDVDALMPLREAVLLRRLDLVLPKITVEVCQALCIFYPFLETISIQLTSVDIPESAMELLQSKSGLQHLSVIGPQIRPS